MSKRSFVGSVFMISGCAMGAGCLAMPMLAAGPNFIFSSIFLILTGIFSYLLASVSLEIFLLYKNEVNTSTVVKQNFGNTGVVISVLINGALMYALLSVYMTGGADLLNKTIFPIISIHASDQVALIIFLAIFLPIFFKGANLVVRSNKVVFYVKLITFLIAIISGISFLSKDLGNLVIEQLKYIPRALPIFLGALWFHFIIPVVAKLNDYDRDRCNRVFKVGLILPVVLYILWVGAILSLIPRDGVGHTFFSLLSKKESVGTMITYAMNNNPHIPNIMKVSLNVFSNIALLTSFLTVGLSTYDFIRDTFRIKQTRVGVLRNLTITMLPPAIFALFFPNGFVFILQQAIILLMLTNIIVISCLLKEYNKLERKPNRLMIYGLLITLAVLIIFQLIDNFGMLPAYGA
ncbi:MAG: aromatic amino acid transport family protein [Neisseriaceae bacterium]